MTTFWGVDSAQPANSMVQNQTLFDFITEQCGQPPAFWGRYIGGRFALTAVEEKFLHDRGCRILVVYNGTRNSPRSVQGGFAEGANDANKAIAAAQTLGIPGGVRSEERRVGKEGRDGGWT